MKKKKVLQVAYHSLANGGIQAVIMGIVRNASDDIDFDIILFTSKKEYYDEEFQKYGEIYRIPLREKENYVLRKIEPFYRIFILFFGVYSILKRHKYDAIHCHNEMESGICTLAAKLAGVKVRISHAHNAESPKHKGILKKFYQYLMKKLIQRYSNYKIGCSKQAIEFMFGENNESNTFVVNNAIDLDKFNSELNKININKAGTQFVHVGRFSYQKNQLFLLEVFKEIKIKLPNAQLSLVGFGEDEEAVKAKINTLNLESSVSILPHDSNLPKIYAESDYMIFPSRYEGLGIVLIEAQVMNVRCFVSTAVPNEANLGLCEYIDLSLSPKKWADLILDNINSNSKSEVSAVVKEKFNVKSIVREYQEIYESN